ncbi:hypothetical protein SAMN05216299_10423 [Nitrosospira sp. Nsp14]|nr:hypothetical protein SAMN05216299_10423 [Nitrosospira sp. Nsp14]
MLTFLAVTLSIGLAVIMTLGLAGAVYANRRALPVCAAMFFAILIFGATW